MAITYISWLIFLFSFYLLHSEFETLPSQVPTKYNFDGSVQKEGPKSTLYILVAVGFMIAVLMTGLLFLEDVQDAKLVLETTNLLTQLLFAFIIHQTIKVAKGLAEGLSKMFYFLLAGVIILPLLLAL